MTRHSKAKGPRTDKPSAANGPSLDERFQYELQKRSSLEGIALAAMGGDREAIRQMAGAAEATCSMSPKAEEPVFDWLMFVLGRIRTGEEPNAAFGWKRHGKGAPKPSQDFESLSKQWLVGQHMTALAGPHGEKEKRLSQAEAAREVSISRHVSEGEAKRLHVIFQTKGDLNK